MADVCCEDEGRCLAVTCMCYEDEGLRLVRHDLRQMPRFVLFLFNVLR